MDIATDLWALQSALISPRKINSSPLTNITDIPCIQINASLLPVGMCLSSPSTTGHPASLSGIHGLLTAAGYLPVRPPLPVILPAHPCTSSCCPRSAPAQQRAGGHLGVGRASLSRHSVLCVGVECVCVCVCMCVCVRALLVVGAADRWQWIPASVTWWAHNLIRKKVYIRSFCIWKAIIPQVLWWLWQHTGPIHFQNSLFSKDSYSVPIFS